MCRRRKDQEHPTRWEFPGGKIEPDESPDACLRRELREELAIEAEVGALIARVNHAYPGGPTVDLWFYAVESHEGTIRNQVFAELRWVTLDQLDQLDLLEADRPVVDILRRSAA